MSLLELLQIVGALLQAAKEAQEIAENLKAKGMLPSSRIPALHEQKIRDVLKGLPADTEWDIDHTNAGG